MTQGDNMTFDFLTCFIVLVVVIAVVYLLCDYFMGKPNLPYKPPTIEIEVKPVKSEMISHPIPQEESKTIWYAKIDCNDDSSIIVIPFDTLEEAQQCLESYINNSYDPEAVHSSRFHVMKIKDIKWITITTHKPAWRNW